AGGLPDHPGRGSVPHGPVSGSSDHAGPGRPAAPGCPGGPGLPRAATPASPRSALASAAAAPGTSHQPGLSGDDVSPVGPETTGPGLSRPLSRNRPETGVVQRPGASELPA